MAARVPCGTCGARFRHSHAQDKPPARAFAAARAFGYLLVGVATAILLLGQAHAGELDGGPNPDGGLDYGALVDVPRAVYAADGGPFDGVCLTHRRAAFLAGYCAQEHVGREETSKELLKQPEGWSTPEVGVAVGLATVLGFAAGVYATVKIIGLAK